MDRYTYYDEMFGEYSSEYSRKELIKKLYEYEEMEEKYQSAASAIEYRNQKKVEFYGDSEDGKMLCPSCSSDLWDVKNCGFSYCPYCGQALRWIKKRRNKKK